MYFNPRGMKLSKLTCRNSRVAGSTLGHDFILGRRLRGPSFFQVNLADLLSFGVAEITRHVEAEESLSIEALKGKTGNAIFANFILGLLHVPFSPR